MPPANNEILPVQAELLGDKFNQEERTAANDPHHNMASHENEDREWKKFMFIVTNGPFFRLFVDTLSKDNEIRRIWDRVAKGPLYAIESLGLDPHQFATNEDMKTYIESVDPDTYAALAEAFEELERHYGQFRDELNNLIKHVDPEASTALTLAIEEGNIDEASHIIETFGALQMRKVE